MQVVEAMTGRAWRVARGDVVVLTDVEGRQVADLFLVDADDVAATGSATAARSTTATIPFNAFMNVSVAPDGGGARPIGVDVRRA
jgi:uncharacterized protein YcgI (DUF1989 family)